MFHDIFVSLSSNNSVVSMSNSLSARLTYRIMAVVLVRMVTRDRYCFNYLESYIEVRLSEHIRQIPVLAILQTLRYVRF